MTDNREIILRELRDKLITPEEARRRLQALATTVPEQVSAPAQSAPDSTTASSAVAIVGMSGRYASAADLEEYWDLLAGGRDGVRPLPERFHGAALDDVVSPRIGYLDGVEMFDPTYFQIPYAEARAMDPQHRLFLQECAKAFQRAGYSRSRLSGVRCGVYLGMANGDYLILADRAGSTGASVTSASNAVAAGRVSYFFNLLGPALTIDTACSSSLVATHLAVAALLGGEIDMAVVGGAATYLSVDGLADMAQAGMLSPSGACRAFSDDADGFVPGEGAGAVVLRRLGDALRDGDPVQAVIIGSGVNQDGRTNGITAPNLASQRALATQVYRDSHVDPRTISYAEMHGTGTVLGDPTELTALAGAFREWTPDTGFCTIGSVKSNLGHISAAAGVAGLQKIVMCLEHRELVPTLHYSSPNRHFDFESSPFTVGTDRRPWDSTGPRRAALSSFGFSGTNAHLVVQESQSPTIADRGTPGPVVLVLSAHSEEQLAQAAVDLARTLRQKPDLDLRDVALTLQRGRDQLPLRAAAVALDPDQAVKLLDQLAAGGDRWQQGRAKRSSAAPVSAADGLEAMAAQWVAGREVDWSGLEQTRVGRTVVLPTYPFERVPLWFEPGEQARSSATTTSRLTVSTNDWRLAEHRVNGVQVLPASASAEIMWQSTAAEGTPVALTALSWPASALTRDQDLHLELCVGDQGLELRHGGVTTASAHAAAPGQPRRVELPVLRDVIPVDRQSHGATAYGPHFCHLVDLRRDSDRCVGELRPQQDQSWAGVLDSAWQAAGPMLPPDRTWLPFAADRIEVHGPPALARRVVVKRVGQGTLSFDIDITDQVGNVLASTSGLAFAPISVPQSFVARPVWREAPSPAGRPVPLYVRDADGGRVKFSGVTEVVAEPSLGEAAVLVPPTVSDDADGARAATMWCHEEITRILAVGAPSRVLVVDSTSGRSAAIAALSGYLATVRLETSLVTTLLSCDQMEALPDLALNEVPHSDAQVRVVGTTRSVRVLEETTLPDADWTPGETALVVGGSSGVGALLASAVVDAGGRVAVLSRRGAPSPLPAWAAAAGARVMYLTCDVSNEVDTARALDRVHQEWGNLDAVYHAAGILDDSLIQSITANRAANVFAAKAKGFDVLDRLLAQEELSRVVLCSSVSAGLGNPGQALYCAANAYLDAAARRREAQRVAGDRHGRTVSVQWPFWSEGGMRISDDAAAAMKRDLGMVALATPTGLTLVPKLLASDEPVLLCAEGSLESMRRSLLPPTPGGHATPTAATTEPSEGVAVADPRELALAAATLVRDAICQSTSTPVSKVRLDDTFEDLGLDSIVIMDVTRRLEGDLGHLPKTLFFEHSTVEELAFALAESHGSRLAQRVRSDQGQPSVAPAPPSAIPASADETAPATPRGGRDIAIIGMSGRFPGAQDVHELWQALQEGRDCITEVPAERWDHSRYVGDQGVPGTTYARWGGFLDDVDKFDPLFFGISPAEADFLSPQARLFLQECWHAAEDAGYTRQQLAQLSVGVFVGVMYDHYGLLRGTIDGHSVPVPTSFAAIANRVSHAMNLHGPSIALDTMCSSSLTALHAAVASLRDGTSDMALVGGVNLTVHPDKLVLLAQGKFASRDGRCRAFGEGGTGYVPSEAVGAFVLKPLGRAIEDHDHVWGVIRGTAVNSGGHAGGFTVPSPTAQAQVIAAALQDADVTPDAISYVEAHGTGTELGDPIEVRALGQVLAASHREAPCFIGSVKGNLGHCESAAGVASVAKVLLQMRHKSLVPSIHSQPANPHIDFEGASLRVVHELTPWVPQGVRRAGVSAFGAGGSNAHVVLEEAPALEERQPAAGSQLLVFSAREKGRLRALLERLVTCFSDPGDLRLDDVAFTLQTGREEMSDRCALVTSDLVEAAAQLEAFLAGRETRVVSGRARRASSSLEAAEDSPDTAALLGQGAWTGLAEAWVGGAKVPWMQAWSGRTPRRASLPGYPFAKERCWVQVPEVDDAPVSHLHPMVHENRSTLDGVAFATHFSGAEPWLVDHHVDGQAVLPGAAMLEMLRTAAAMAMAQPVALTQVLFLRPCKGASLEELEIRVERHPAGAHVRLTSGSLEFCEALAVPATTSGQRRDLALPSGSAGRSVSAAAMYDALRDTGLEYGPTHRTVESIHLHAMVDGTGDMARVVLRRTRGTDRVVLDPGLIDGALQGTWAVLNPGGAQSHGQMLPFAVDHVEVHTDAPLPDEVTADIREDVAAREGERQVTIDVVSPSGQQLVTLQGVRFRPTERDRVLATLRWEPASLAVSHPPSAPGTWLVLTDREELFQLLPEAEVELLTVATTTAETFGAAAEKALLAVQRALRGRSDRTVVQLALSEDSLLRGVFPMLRTAGAEEVFGAQLLLSPQATDAAILASWLREELAATHLEQVVRRDQHERSAERLVESPWPQFAQRPAGDGVWLITGGAGGIGRLVAQDITSRAAETGAAAHVVLLGRSAPDDRVVALTSCLSQGQTTCSYEQVDVTDEGALRAVVERVKGRYGPVTDVVHAAGVLRDGLLATKSVATMREVLEPKVRGTIALHRATLEEPLRSFVICSSLAGTVANQGQADYAAANGFEDQFARWRRDETGRGQGSGTTVSIGWPLWADAGMQLGADDTARMTKDSGLVPLETPEALAVFHALRLSEHAHAIPLVGQRRAMHAYLERGRGNPAMSSSGGTAAESAPTSSPVVATAGHAKVGVDDVALRLRSVLAGLVRMAEERLELDEPLDSYGVDSIVVVDFAERLRPWLGGVPKSVFFDTRTLRELAEVLMASRPDGCARLAVPQEVAGVPHGDVVTADRGGSKVAVSASAAPQASARGHRVAVVGLAGRYPQARDLAELWDNLLEGKDCIERITADRWTRAGARVHPDDRSLAWGGFLDDADCFDDRFFSIAPVEAEMMDPQERVLLECAHHALEDAGYRPEDLAAKGTDRSPAVGVFVGSMYSEYQLYGAQSQLEPDGYTLNGVQASLANRVSYTFGFGGPSLAVDSMCSSSLSALHLACQSIRAGECDAALVGGVNLSVHPNKFRLLGSNGFAADGGRCRAFSVDADGYVPSEGVGVAVLKPLAQALADHDHIYGVIEATSIGHGGHSNGFTYPRPAAQAKVIGSALRAAGLSGRDVDYVEAHGTGTKLGDPLEIDALAQALGRDRDKPCLIGSVKSNLGHCEGAAGMASLSKVLLQMQHETLAPSIHAAELNPEITWDEAGIEIVREVRPWPATSRRVAGISAFGAGGSNAHAVVSSVADTDRGEQPIEQAFEFPVSGCRAEDLKPLAQALLGWVRQRTMDARDLANLSYTLKVGRVPQEHRALLVAGTQGELEQQLQALLADERVTVPSTDHGQAWLRGERPTWQSDDSRRRVSAPGYPFARRRHWRPSVLDAQRAAVHAVAEHPLLHRNESSLFTQSFVSTFGPQAGIVADHRVAGRPVLAGAASLEMMLCAASQSLELPTLSLHDVVWSSLVSLESPTEVRTTVVPRADSLSVEVAAAGVGLLASSSASLDRPVLRRNKVDPAELVGRWGGLEPGDDLVKSLAGVGLDHGPGYRSLLGFSHRGDEVVAMVGMPTGQPASLAPLLNAAFECAVLLGDEAGLRVPFTASTVRRAETPVPPRALAHLVRRRTSSSFVLDVVLWDDLGHVIVEVDGLVLRQLKENPSA